MRTSSTNKKKKITINTNFYRNYKFNYSHRNSPSSEDFKFENMKKNGKLGLNSPKTQNYYNSYNFARTKVTLILILF